MSIFDALAKNDIQLIKKLIKDKNNLECRDIHGNTPLHCIHTMKQLKLLIKFGADVNAKNSKGCTQYKSNRQN